MRAVAIALLAVVQLHAQEEKKPEGPGITVVTPLAVARGRTAKLTVHGLKLDEASQVKLVGDTTAVEATILSKGKVNVPNQQDAKVVGDTQVELEVTLPESTPPGAVSLVVVTPGGESPPCRLLVLPAEQLAAEQEPNEGFHDAQRIELGKVVQGTIGQPKDVDVFQFTGTAGQPIEITVAAAQHGSALDSVVMVFDDRGRLLASGDDTGQARDSSLRVILPSDGGYHVGVMDANDQGGPAHVYQLSAAIARP